MAPKKTTPKKAAKKTSRKPSAKSAKKTRRATKVAAKKVVKKSSAKRPVAKAAAKKAAKKSVAKKSVAKKAPGKKAPAKKAPPTRAAVTKKAPVVRRRDNSGHIDPGYAEKLREQSREAEPQGRAFLDGPRSNDSLAEELGEETVGAMTTGEDESDRLEQDVDEDEGGPFVETEGSDEFADGVDESNPEDATREPFPTS